LTSSSDHNPAAERGGHALLGYLAIAGAALFWGASATLGKAVFTGRLVSAPSLRSLDPLILAQTRTSFSVLVLAPALLRRRPKALALSRREITRCLLLGIAGVAASNYFYYLAIEKTTVATAIVLQYTAPVWVLLYMVARRLQRATVLRILAVAAAVMGCALAIGIGGPAHLRINLIGVTAAFAAAFSFAFYNVYGHGILAQQERWTTIVFALLGASLFWILVNPPWKIVAAHYSGAQWAFLAVFAFTSMLMPFSLYFTGLQYLDATRAIVTSCLEPVFAILFAAAFVDESLHPLQVAGIVVVLLATVAVQIPDKRRGEQADAQLSMAE
jgi:drug/metabolite transporter (DMT)-like permease